MATAKDQELLVEARKEAATVVTLDSDFHAILAITRATSPSVIRIRIERLKLKGIHLALLIQRVLEAVGHEFQAGAAVTVTENRLAVRLLPLIRDQTGHNAQGIEQNQGDGA